MSRQKKEIIQQVSEEQYQEALKQYAQSEATLRKTNAEIDLKTLAIRDKYASTLEEHGKQRERCFEVVQQYCEEHPELFAKKKSLDTAYGQVGFRTGTPKLKTRKGFTWASVLELAKEKLQSYVRVKEELNKEALLMDREKVDIKAIGVEVDQSESFFISVKEDENL